MYEEEEPIEVTAVEISKKLRINGNWSDMQASKNPLRISDIIKSLKSYCITTELTLDTPPLPIKTMNGN